MVTAEVRRASLVFLLRVDGQQVEVVLTPHYLARAAEHERETGPVVVPWEACWRVAVQHWRRKLRAPCGGAVVVFVAEDTRRWGPPRLTFVTLMPRRYVMPDDGTRDVVL